jgi:hypothetical protein
VGLRRYLLARAAEREGSEEKEEQQTMRMSVISDTWYCGFCDRSTSTQPEGREMEEEE